LPDALPPVLPDKEGGGGVLAPFGGSEVDRNVGAKPRSEDYGA
jgi:hypothetical protein